jgi:hypothetical protein
MLKGEINYIIAVAGTLVQLYIITIGKLVYYYPTLNLISGNLFKA